MIHDGPHFPQGIYAPDRKGKTEPGMGRASLILSECQRGRKREGLLWEISEQLFMTKAFLHFHPL